MIENVLDMPSLVLAARKIFEPHIAKIEIESAEEFYVFGAKTIAVVSQPNTNSWFKIVSPTLNLEELDLEDVGRSNDEAVDVLRQLSFHAEVKGLGLKDISQIGKE